MSTKEKVLAQLTENKSKPVSGEALASLCGVTRAAIWKAVKALREEGYTIEGTTNGGYVLSEETDLFSKEIFHRYLNSSWNEYCSFRHECFSQIDSTNNYAKTLVAQAGSLRFPDKSLTPAGKELHNAAIISEKQTAGRGRLGRTFESPEKTGIYISVIYAPEGGITKPAQITAAAAVAVYNAIEKLYEIKTSIKWINDLFFNKKKLVGILTEGIANFETGTIEAAIIGIGVNVFKNPALPEEIKKIASSIDESNPSKRPCRAQLAAEIYGQLLKVLSQPVEKTMEEYKSHSFLIGQTVTVYPVIDQKKSGYKAEVIDIDEEASLVVKTETGDIKKLSSGEVSLKSSELTKD